jgi:hypothetical protein
MDSKKIRKSPWLQELRLPKHKVRIRLLLIPIPQFFRRRATGNLDDSTNAQHQLAKIRTDGQVLIR